MRRVAIDPVLSVAHAYRDGAEVTECRLPLTTMEVGDVVARSTQTVSLCATCRLAE